MMSTFARSMSRRHLSPVPSSSLSICRQNSKHSARPINAAPTTTTHRPILTKAALPKAHRLEVERKFVPDSTSMSLLRRNNQWPGTEAARLITPYNGLHFTDTYFDTPDFRLRNPGIYVRRRNSKWEMKMRQTGDLVSSGCVEVQGQTQVETWLEESGFDLSLTDLQPIAEMETVRHAWEIGRFVVSVDDTMLLLKGTRVPHCVGEVELCEDYVGESKEVQMQRMIQRIDEFMERHMEVFRARNGDSCAQVPEGKLAAFFRWQHVVKNRGVAVASPSPE